MAHSHTEHHRTVTLGQPSKLENRPNIQKSSVPQPSVFQVVKPLGITSGRIPDSAINATSERGNYEARNIRSDMEVQRETRTHRRTQTWKLRSAKRRRKHLVKAASGPPLIHHLQSGLTAQCWLCSVQYKCSLQ